MPDKMIKLKLAVHKIVKAEMFALEFITFIIDVIAIIITICYSNFLYSVIFTLMAACLAFIIVHPGLEYYDRREELCCFDKGEIIVTFNPVHCSNVWQKKCIIKFSDISNIQYNREYGFLDIESLYTVEINDNMGSYHNGKLRLYGYIRNFSDIIKLISSKSGIPITKV